MDGGWGGDGVEEERTLAWKPQHATVAFPGQVCWAMRHLGGPGLGKEGGRGASKKAR